jgi:protein arginine N-methyltransferase 3
MLDSVLHARDRFLAPGGEMMPGRTRLLLSAIAGDKLWSERMTFWESVYGFDMTAMRGVYAAEGIVDTIPASEVCTSEHDLYTIDSHVATPQSLDFETPFRLTVQRDATIRAFLTHFDTFFGAGEVVDTTYIGDDTASTVQPAQGPVSFTTGPRGKETHWKQVSFLLDKPIEVKEGDVIAGTFHCRKSATNTRELDVQLHIDGYGIRLYRVR